MQYWNDPLFYLGIKEFNWVNKSVKALKSGSKLAAEDTCTNFEHIQDSRVRQRDRDNKSNTLVSLISKWGLCT